MAVTSFVLCSTPTETIYLDRQLDDYSWVSSDRSSIYRVLYIFYLSLRGLWLSFFLSILNFSSICKHAGNLFWGYSVLDAGPYHNTGIRNLVSPIPTPQEYSKSLYSNDEPPARWSSLANLFTLFIRWQIGPSGPLSSHYFPYWEPYTKGIFMCMCNKCPKQSKLLMLSQRIELSISMHYSSHVYQISATSYVRYCSLIFHL